MFGKEMPFRTVVEMPKMKRIMQLGDSFVFLGSCFAEYMGHRFSDYGLPVVCNPLGVLFNPASLLSAVKGAAEEDETSWPLFQHEGQWHCWLAGTQLSAADETSCLALMNEAFGTLRQGLNQAQYLFLTLGSSVCYRLRQNGMVVANCHKVPSTHFEEHWLDAEECGQNLLQAAHLAHKLNPDLHIVFTVSPYRYAKYGFHGSQLSKAALLLGIDKVCKEVDWCSYLPVYEIFMDELRDYRFYAEDMIHPSPVAVDYVWQRLVRECMDKSLQAYLSEYDPLRKALAHRPQAPESPQYQAFLAETKAQLAALKARYRHEET